ncbi:MAG: molybdenum cofactor guanylyltransferase [Actinomycetota bacterium]|nr:molybdenum cofactor guanylyltransferase [Actinomycetota bacterium]
MADRTAAIVLAGGMARRMGGTDKLVLRVAGATLLDRVLEAAAGVSGQVVAVGPERPTAVPGVEFVQESTPGGGPLPAIAAGLRHLDHPEVVLVLAGDLPLLTSAALRRLRDGLAADPASEAMTAADHAGRPNPLLAAYRAPALGRAVHRWGSAGEAASRLLPRAVAVVDLGPEATLNVNSPLDLEEAARLAGLHPS